MDKLIQAIVETVEIFVIYIEGMRIEYSINTKGTYTILYKGEVYGESAEKGIYNVMKYYQEKGYSILLKDGYVEMKKEE